mmetsp:Transcript_65295/g.142222  ORF Transcript_65295/g.142222 Transcript_65295/m.142222 type:complete len:296 (-) Transcript_65295:1180-2067(-)
MPRPSNLHRTYGEVAGNRLHAPKNAAQPRHMSLVPKRSAVEDSCASRVADLNQALIASAPRLADLWKGGRPLPLGISRPLAEALLAGAPRLADLPRPSGRPLLLGLLGPSVGEPSASFTDAKLSEFPLSDDPCSNFVFGGVSDGKPATSFMEAGFLGGVFSSGVVGDTLTEVLVIRRLFVSSLELLSTASAEVFFSGVCSSGAALSASSSGLLVRRLFATMLGPAWTPASFVAGTTSLCAGKVAVIGRLAEIRWRHVSTSLAGAAAGQPFSPSLAEGDALVVEVTAAASAGASRG